MPRPVPQALRQQIWYRFSQLGHAAAAIAAALGLKPRTVQQLLSRFRQGGAEALAPSYQHAPTPCARRSSSCTSNIPPGAGSSCASSCKTFTPSKPSPAPAPCNGGIRTRSSQRLWPAASPRPSASPRDSRTTSGKSMPPTRSAWPAAGRSPGCGWWTSSPGPCSAPAFSPQSSSPAVPAPTVQDVLRQQFACWGLPRRLRVDNGVPWGNWNDLPTALALWLIGLGVDVLWNDPGHPEQNPKVERAQGTGKRWAEPQQCRDVAQLQEHFDRVDLIQRARYPAVGGRSRLEAFPELAQVQRRYTHAWEQRHWDLGRVLEHLAGYVAVRRVSSSGHLSVYASDYYVGKAYSGQTVQVALDPSARQWVCTDSRGTQLRCFPAQQITRARLMKLSLTGK
jgi:hypothetical protein